MSFLKDNLLTSSASFALFKAASTKGLPKPTRDFNERLRHIKKIHPGSPIEVRD